jgi:ATP-dependent DNA helicase PIF1
VLVIDEVSQLDATIFEALDLIARSVRPIGSDSTSSSGENPRPFGALQLVFCGDFFQLPPVTGRFCFQVPLWPRTFASEHCVELSRVYRQGGPDEEQFVHALHQVRRGGRYLTDEAIDLLSTQPTQTQTQSPSTTSPRGQPSVMLVPTRAKAASVNLDELARLDQATEREFEADDWSGPGVHDALADSMFSQLPKRLRLRIGSRVMITANVRPRDGLVNGAVGE